MNIAAYNAKLLLIAQELWSLEAIVGKDICSRLHGRMYEGASMLRADFPDIVIPDDGDPKVGHK